MVCLGVVVVVLQIEDISGCFIHLLCRRVLSSCSEWRRSVVWRNLKAKQGKQFEGGIG